MLEPDVAGGRRLPFAFHLRLVHQRENTGQRQLMARSATMRQHTGGGLR